MASLELSNKDNRDKVIAFFIAAHAKQGLKAGRHPVVAINLKDLFKALGRSNSLRLRLSASIVSQVIDELNDFFTGTATCAEIGTLLTLAHFEADVVYSIAADCVWSRTKAYHSAAFEFNSVDEDDDEDES